MGSNEFRSDDEAEAGAAFFGRALKRLEQFGAGGSRNAGAIVADFNSDDAPCSPGPNRDLARCGWTLGFDCLHGVAREV